MEKIIIHCNSAQRSVGTSSDFTFDISQELGKIINNDGSNYNQVALLAFNMPKSYYLINDSNDLMTLVEFSDATPPVQKNTPIYISHGNYSANSLVTEIKKQFGLAGLLRSYDITFSSSTGKLTFTITGPVLSTSRQTQFIFPATYPIAGLHRIIGFNHPSQTPINYFTSNILTSPNVINLQLATSVKLYTDMTSDEGGLLSSIIADNTDFSSITWHNNTPNYTSRRLTNSLSKTARFWLLNGDTNLPLDLNGLNFNFVVILWKDFGASYYKTMLADYKIKQALDNLD